MSVSFMPFSTVIFRSLWGHHQSDRLLVDGFKNHNEFESEVSYVAAPGFQVDLEAERATGDDDFRVAVAKELEKQKALELASRLQDQAHEAQVGGAGDSFKEGCFFRALPSDDLPKDAVEGFEEESSCTKAVSLAPSVRSLIPDVQIRGSLNALEFLQGVSHNHYRGGLKVEGFLGRGKFGAVYHVKIAKLKESALGSVVKIKNYALKIIFEGNLALTSRIIELEIGTLASLKHRSIVKYKGDCKDCGFVLFNKVPGCSLEKALMEGSISKLAFKQVAAHLIYLLRFLEIKRVAHLDFKPANIMVDLSNKGFPSVTLIDFGSAIGGINSSKKYPEGPVCYRAPEMYNCFFGRTSYDLLKTQWYALGVTLYFMAYQIYPYDETDITDLDYDWIQNALRLKALNLGEGDLWQYIYTTKYPADPPKSYGGDYDAQLHDLIVTLLERDVKKRAGFEAAKSHPWFEGFDWSFLEESYADVMPEAGRH